MRSLLGLRFCVVRNEKVSFLRWINAECFCSYTTLNMMHQAKQKWPLTYSYISTRYMTYGRLSLLIARHRNGLSPRKEEEEERKTQQASVSAFEYTNIGRNGERNLLWT